MKNFTDCEEVMILIALTEYVENPKHKGTWDKENKQMLKSIIKKSNNNKTDVSIILKDNLITQIKGAI